MSCQGLNVAAAHLVKLVLPHILIALAVFFSMSSYSKDGRQNILIVSCAKIKILAFIETLCGNRAEINSKPCSNRFWKIFCVSTVC